MLAYRLVHTIRFRLKADGIHLSWEGARREFAGQVFKNRRVAFGTLVFVPGADIGGFQGPQNASASGSDEVIF